MPSGKNGNKTSRRRQALSSLSSFSLSFRSPLKKKPIVIHAQTPPICNDPICRKRAHYSVFNSQNPRHNPSAKKPARYLSQSSVSSNPVSWVQSLPRRSLRKARSSFLALKSGMSRRGSSNEESPRLGIPSFWLLPRPSSYPQGPEEHQASSSVSVASTEEDRDFGVGLYRTECNSAETVLENDLKDAASSNNTTVAPDKDGKTPRGSESLVIEETRTRSQKDDKSDVESDETPKNKFTTEGSCNNGNSLNNEASDRFESNTPSSNPRRVNIPQIIGIDLAMERLQVFDDKIPDAIRDHETGHPLGSVETSGNGNIKIACNADMPVSSEETQEMGVGKNAEVNEENKISSSDSPIQTDLTFSELPPSANDNASSYAERLSDYQRQSDEYAEEPNNPWAPIDDEVLSLPSVRDEYFLVDKSNDFPPDRGNEYAIHESVKTERFNNIFQNGSGLERSASVKSDDAPELVGPGGFIHAHVSRPRNPFRIERNSNDSTDEYIATFPVIERR